MQQLRDHREPADRNVPVRCHVPPQVIHEAPKIIVVPPLAGRGPFQVAAPLQEEHVF